MWGFKGFYQGMKVPEGIKLPFSIVFAVTRDFGLSSGPLSISVSHVSFASTSLFRFVSVCLLQYRNGKLPHLCLLYVVLSFFSVC